MLRISVIMPAYNAEKYIKEAIDSILSQTFGDFEFIIIDDGSTDNTCAIVESYSDSRIRFFRNEKNMGVAATLNRGLDLARGEYIARMDSDDICCSKRFEVQKKYLDANSNIVVIGSDIEMFCDEKNIKIQKFSRTPARLKEDLYFSCCIAHPSVMFRKKVIKLLGGYDLNYNGLEDYELWDRVADKYEIAVVPEVLLRYRIHNGQVTKSPTLEYSKRMRNLKLRQTERINVQATPEEFTAYFNYCTGTLSKTYQETALLCSFFEKTLLENYNAGNYYKREYLLDDFKSVIIGLCSNFSEDDQKKICMDSKIINYRDILVTKFKGCIKKCINR